MSETDEEKLERRRAARKMSHVQMHQARTKMDQVLSMIDHDLERNEEVMSTVEVQP